MTGIETSAAPMPDVLQLLVRAVRVQRRAREQVRPEREALVPVDDAGRALVLADRHQPADGLVGPADAGLNDRLRTEVTAQLACECAALTTGALRTS